MATTIACTHDEHSYVREQMEKIDELLRQIDALTEIFPFTTAHYTSYKKYIDKVSLTANLIPDPMLDNECCRNQMGMAKQKADSTSHRFIEAAYEANRLGKCIPRGYDLFPPEGKN